MAVETETQLEAWLAENIAGGGHFDPLDNPASSSDIRIDKQAYTFDGNVITGEWRPYEFISQNGISSEGEWTAAWSNVWRNLGRPDSGAEFFGWMHVEGALPDSPFSMIIPIIVKVSGSYQVGSGGGYEPNDGQGGIITFGANFSDTIIYINGVDVTANVNITSISFGIYYQIS